MTDREKIVWLAEKFGTLKKLTVHYAYISNVRYEFDTEGYITKVSEPMCPGSRNWREVK